MDQEQLAALLAQFGSRFKAIGAPVGPYLHGPNGLWSVPGMERDVISTRVRPRGLAGVLPARGTNTMNPLYPYLTGFTDPAETQPENVCDDPPTAGQMKNCIQTAVFGRYSYQTRVIDLTQLGQIINRSEFTDLRLVNDPLAGTTPGITRPATTPGRTSLTNEVSARFAEVGIKFQNKLMRQLWEGNPANNTGGGGYQEFLGLESLIGTGKVDAVTGAACPALNSLVVNAAFKNVNDNTGDTIFELLTYAMRVLSSNAEAMGLSPATWALVMPEPMFYEVTAQWPCTYMTYRCITESGGQAGVNAGDMVAMRDEMRNNRYLVIDGVRYNVIVDDALNVDVNADNASIPVGSFGSTIKIVPLTVAGNIAATFWEYFDFGGPGAMMSSDVLGLAPGLRDFFWSDGGQYVWHTKPPVNWCVQWLGMMRPRVILRTPHLAGEINNVVYTPLMSPRQPFSGDPNYVNGGVTSRTTAPSLTLS